MPDDADRWDDVDRSEELIERVNAGDGPPTGDQAGDVMAVWRDAVRDPTERIRYTDPATSQLPHVLYGDPRHNPIAFLPADPEDRVTYGGAVDYPHVHHDALSGDLATVTDDEWRDAHERLIADLPDQAGHLTYVWAPGAPSPLIGERDMAPEDGTYDPATDERFQGGGFRG